jgi:hypothetical protein
MFVVVIVSILENFTLLTHDRAILSTNNNSFLYSLSIWIVCFTYNDCRAYEMKKVPLQIEVKVRLILKSYDDIFGICI